MSEARSLEVVFPGDTNHMGTLFGGTLMAWMDRAAYFAASRRARGTVVTRKVDELGELNKLKDGAELIKRDGSVPFTGNIDAGNNKLVNVAAGVNATDAVNKAQLDAVEDKVGGTLITREIVSGPKDGVNVTFTLAEEPTLATEQIFFNGALLNAGANADYTISGNVITFSVPPQSGDSILANYVVDAIQLNVDVQATINQMNGRLSLVEADMATAESDIDALEAADVAMDARMATAETDISALEVRATNIETNVDAVEADIAAEESRAMAAESALDVRVSASEVEILGVKSRMTAAEGDIDDLEAADVAMDSRVSDLEDGLQAETVARTNAVNSLNTRVVALENDDTAVDGRLDILETDVAALEIDLSAEAATRLANDNTLQSNINAEIAARTSAVSGVQTNLNTEIANRTSADTTLQNNINSEASARAAADSALDVRLLSAESNLAFPDGHLYDDNASAYSNGQRGVIDPSSLVRDGWYYKNTVAGQKINWYFFDGVANNVTLENFSAYAVVTLDANSFNSARPFLTVYTTPTGSGDAVPGFYKSSRFYTWPTGSVVGTKYLIYFGQNPPVHPELPRVALTPGAIQGTFASSERILSVAFHSDSGAAVNTVQLMVERLGVFTPTYKMDAELRIRRATKIELDAEASARSAADTTLQNNINAEASARAAADNALDARIDALEADPVSQAYVDQKIADLVNSAPAVLDTLKELSDALGGDENFATTIAADIAAVDDRVDTVVADLAQEAIDRAADVDAEESRAMAAESALDVRIDALEADPVTKTYVDGEVSGLDARVDALESAPPPVTALSYLSDVTVASPSNGQVLQYNGTEWVNGPAPSTFSGSYNDLSNKPDLSVYALDTDVAAIDTRVEALEDNAFVTREIPSGSINGSNAVFTLANTPVSGSEQVFVNGMLQESGAGNDYTISGGTITFASAPLSGWKVHVSYATGSYMVAPGGSSSGSGAEVFQDAQFTWNNGSSTRTITHNKGRFPDMVKVFVQRGSSWVEHYDHMVSGVDYGWDSATASSTVNSHVVRLFNIDGASSIPCRIRLYWFSASDVGSSSSGWQ